MTGSYTREYCRHLLTFDAEVRRIRGQRIAADPNRVFSWLDDLPSRVIKEGQLTESQRKADLLRFSRCERHPQKTLQAAHRLFEAGSSIAEVTLHDFGGGNFAGICNGGGCNDKSGGFGRGLLEGNGVAGEGDGRIGEGGIGETEAERKQCGVGSVDVAGDEAGFGAGGLGEVGVVGGTAGGHLVVVEGLLAFCLGEAHGEFAGWGDVSIEDAGERVAGFVSGKRGFADGLRFRGAAGAPNWF